MVQKLFRRSGPQTACCATSSVNAGEPLYGSANQVQTWLLLEYAGEWRQQATTDNDLPPAVQAYIGHAMQKLLLPRLQFIKHQESRAREGWDFYVGIAQEAAPKFYRFHLTSYEDLLEIDLLAVAAGNDAYDRYLHQEPVYLVCANGKRDICCAQFGVPVYETMLNYAGRSAWQTTHLGGHRLAATGIFLPHGIYYGRLTPANITQLIDTYTAGRLSLEHLRGRSCYEKPVQAAEYFLRQHTGILDLEYFRLEQMMVQAEGVLRVHFTTPAAEARYQVDVHTGQSPFKVLKNSADTQPDYVPYHQLAAFQTLD